MKNITYLSNSRIPSEMANSVQIMKMCEAMSKAGSKVTLIKPNRSHTFNTHIDNLYDYYDIKTKFPIENLRYIDIHKLETKIPNLIYRSLNYTNNLFWERYLFNYYINNHKESIIFMRNTLHFLLNKISKYNIPSIIEFHNLPSQRYISEYVKLFKHSDKVIPLALTKGLAEDLSEKLNINISNILVVPGGVDISKYENTKTSIKHNDKKIKITYVGSLIKNRGVNVLLQSAKYLPNFEFNIIGGVGNDLNCAENYLNDNVITNVNLLGHKPQNLIYEYYQETDILILPMSGKEQHTQRYGSLNKLFEYMASAKPIIVSNLPSVKEVLMNNKNCILFEPDNVDDLVDKIQFLSSSKELMYKIAENAKKDAQNYTWDKRVEKIYNHVQNFIKMQS